MDPRVEKMTKYTYNHNVLYLMRRDFRIFENHSVFLSYDLSNEKQSQLFLLTNISEYNQFFNKRQEKFLKEGLQEMEKDCVKNNLHFIKNESYPNIVHKYNIDCIVTEASPLKYDLEIENELINFCKNNKIALYKCDSHNIVPAKCLKEYLKSARGVKHRLYEHFPKFFKRFPDLVPHQYNKNLYSINNRAILQEKNIENSMNIISSMAQKSKKKKKKGVQKIFTKNIETEEIVSIKQFLDPQNKRKHSNERDFRGGYSYGMKEFQRFLKERFPHFKKLRNNASVDFVSYLEPWVLSGQISTQHIAILAASEVGIDDINMQDFMNEIFVWKETAEHYTYFEKEYDNVKGASDWAIQSLRKENRKKRKIIYEYDAFENMKTRNREWNAAMNELRVTGHIHTYALIYWCKQLIYMTENIEIALDTAHSLFNKYSMVAGFAYSQLWIMYSLVGVMDQGFSHKDYIGKIRPLSSIKAPKYIDKWDPNTDDFYLE